MIRYIAGVYTMKSEDAVTVTDGTKPLAVLAIGRVTQAVLTPEEMRELALCLNAAADRAETRIPETPEEPKDAE